MSFTIKRGTNISHWLSQVSNRELSRSGWFQKRDVEYAAKVGLDHLRLPIDEVDMWAEDGQPDEQAFGMLNDALDWCAESGLRAIIDLHIVRSHYFNDKQEPQLFTDPSAQDYFCDLWHQLSVRLGDRSNDLVAYEILNEAVARDPEDWNRVAMAAYQVIRELEPERTIVLGSNWFNQYQTFDKLNVPASDPNMILTFHYYTPMLITHYQAKWWDGGVYDGPVQYPGLQVTPENVAKLSPELQASMAEWNQSFDRSTIEVNLEQPLAVSKRTGLPLYCGEFGVYHRTPQPLRLAWYKDMMHVLNAHDIAWANWEYKGAGFGLVTADGQDTGIAEVLLA